MNPHDYFLYLKVFHQLQTLHQTRGSSFSVSGRMDNTSSKFLIAYRMRTLLD